MRADKPDSKESWEQTYRESPAERLPWYYRELEPDVKNSLSVLGVRGGKVLDLGTGPGTQAIALAQLGFTVTATDISPTAIENAAERAQELGVKVDWRQDDIVSTGLKGTYDLILDRGCFHTLAPEDRSIYVDQVHKLLPTDGLLLLKTFSYLEPGTEGPYRFTREQIRGYFDRLFVVTRIEDTVFQGNRRPLPKALLAVMRNGTTD